MNHCNESVCEQRVDKGLTKTSSPHTHPPTTCSRECWTPGSVLCRLGNDITWLNRRARCRRYAVVAGCWMASGQRVGVTATAVVAGVLYRTQYNIRFTESSVRCVRNPYLGIGNRNRVPRRDNDQTRTTTAYGPVKPPRCFHTGRVADEF